MGINVTSDEKGNFYLDQKKLIESAVKAAKVSGAKVQKLSYPIINIILCKQSSKYNVAYRAKTIESHLYLLRL